MLTQQELQSIIDEADMFYRRINSFAYPSHMNDIEREWIIKIISEYLTKERERTKKLVDALGWVLKKDGYQYIKDVLSNYQNKTP